MNRMKRILEIEKGFTQISLITQIKYENRYGMNRMIWAEGRELRAER